MGRTMKVAMRTIGKKRHSYSENTIKGTDRRFVSLYMYFVKVIYISEKNAWNQKSSMFERLVII